MVDRHPQANIYSHRPIGLGRDELKWEIPATAVVALRAVLPFEMGLHTFEAGATIRLNSGGPPHGIWTWG